MANAKRPIDICLGIGDTMTSASLIVEMGVQTVLDDVERNGNKSRVLKEVIK